ncbi:aciniform spidroin 1A variant 1, partial [Nephila pilipes]
GAVNSNNAKQVASTLSSNLVREMANSARQYGINVPDAVVQADVNIVTTMTSTMVISSQTSVQMGGAGFPGGDGGFPGGDGGFPGGDGGFPGGDGGFPGADYPAGGAPSDGDAGMISSQMESPLVSAMVKTSTLKAIVGSRPSPQKMSAITKSALQKVCVSLRVNSGALSKLVNDASQSVSVVRPGSPIDVYAKAIISPSVKVLVTSGAVNSNNAKQVASTLSSNLVREMANSARQYGINVPDAVVQADVNIVTTMTSTMVISSQTSVQMGGAGFPGGDGGFPGGDGGFPGGDGGFPGGDGGFPGADYPAGGAPSDGDAGMISSQMESPLVSAMVKTSTLKAIVGSRPSPQKMSAITKSALQKVGVSLRVNSGALSKLVNDASQSVSVVRPGSPIDVYAKAIISPSVKVLVTSGAVNSNNAKQVASTLSSNLVREMANSARQYGINVPDAVVQADVNIVTTMTSTMVISSQTSVQMGGAGFPGGDGGFPGGDGGFPGGDGGFPGGDGGFPGADYPAGGAPSDGDAGMISSQMESPLVSAMVKTSTLKAIVGSRPSPQKMSAITKSALQKVGVSLRVNSGALSKLVNDASQSVSVVRPGSPIDVYAKAIISPSVKVLVTSGAVNSNNAKQVASTLSSNLVREMANSARQYGINVPDAVVQADVNIVTTMTSTMVISSQTSVQMGGAGFPGGDGGFPGGERPYPAGGVPSFVSVLKSPNGLVSVEAKSRINDLASSLLTAVGRNGVDVNVFSNGLRATLSKLAASGMSPSDAKVEVLLEALTAVIQLLSGSTIGVMDTSSTGLTSSSVAQAVSVILA